jgi:hypothetical protein
MTISEAAAWRDVGAARRENMRVEAAQRTAEASRGRFEQRVAEGRLQVVAQPSVGALRLLDIRV